MQTATIQLHGTKADFKFNAATGSRKFPLSLQGTLAGGIARMAIATFVAEKVKPVQITYAVPNGSAIVTFN